MKYFILLLFSSFFLQLANAQPYDASKVNKKAVQLYNQAIERAQDGNLTLAAGLLQQCIEIDKNYVDAYLSLAGVYGQLKNYKRSVEQYEIAFQKDPNYTIDYKLPYSIQLAGLGEFERALSAINELLEKKPPKNENSLKACMYRKGTYEFAIAYAKKNTNKDYVFSPVNMGANVNSAESEYLPSLTIDGSELIFTRRLGRVNEDFFFSRKLMNEWDKSKPIEGEVNTEQNEGGQNISQDGQILVFTGCNRADGFGSCDIYISYHTGNGWSPAVNLGGRINSDQWESQPCLSPDKQSLYFASRRNGGLGGSDIYVSQMQANGKWGEPQNLGPVINSAGDEQSPFLHADNQTLYFTSNFWQGYGETDAFYARRGPGGDWSVPVNLGYPINTINSEGSLFIAADGKTAYYSSDKSDSRGGMDIYSFELREDVRPYKTLWVRGQVFDKKTTKGLPSTVELIDLTTKLTVSKIQTDEEGKYLVTLPVGKDYAFNVNRKGYLFYSDNFSLLKNSPDSSYQKDIPLQPLEVNAAIVLHNVFFDVNRFELQPASQVELEKVIQLLKDNPTLRIEISGHTDNAGKPSDNITLSMNRAKAVISYLVSKGIQSARLVAKGFGETKPAAGNDTEEGRAKNRRTEMKVVGK
ncbi:MAG: OmpA family protein [Chitinophagaceae bacterium]|nr:OmpA family protein [Chitinophagaceae bacterium]